MRNEKSLNRYREEQNLGESDINLTGFVRIILNQQKKKSLKNNSINVKTDRMLFSVVKQVMKKKNKKKLKKNEKNKLNAKKIKQN